jgi:hypothetical protein
LVPHLFAQVGVQWDKEMMFPWGEIQSVFLHGEAHHKDKNNFLFNSEKYVKIFPERTLGSPAPSLIFRPVDHTTFTLIPTQQPLFSISGIILS